MNWQPKPANAKPPAMTPEMREATHYWTMASVFMGLGETEDDADVAWCRHMAVFYETMHQWKARELTYEEASAAFAALEARRPESPFALEIAQPSNGYQDQLSDDQKARIRREVMAKGGK